MILDPLFSTLWALIFLGISSFFRSLFKLNILPRLRFSKTEFSRSKHLFLRWVLVFSRLRIQLRRDFLFLLVLSLQVTCLALLPINGDRGVVVENPQLVLMILCSMACVIYIFASRRAEGGALTEKSLDHMVYFSSQVLIVLILFLGAALGQTQGELSDFLGQEWLFLASPFHFVAFLIGVFVATFSKSASSKDEQVISIDGYIHQLFSLIWLTLFVMVFWNSNTLPGLTHFIFLLIKIISLYLMTDMFWRHVPILRRDQLEKIMLIAIYPLTFACFMGMWWVGVFI